MARKSRKNLNLPTQPEPLRTLKTAIYARLSGNKMNGEVIETQIEIIKNYIDERKNFTLVDIYADNGFTGTDFNRPSFLRLLDDIRDGKINCVIVKDLARFGRNYLEVGDYIENIFPFLGVRFIAIADNYDNINVKPQEYFMTHFKNYVHAYYAFVTSQKISEVKYCQQKQGKFLGSVPPYGYKRDENEKCKFVIDEETAPIIKEIFLRYSNGESASAIAQSLNLRQIPTSRQRYNYSNATNIWVRQTISKILKNEIYIGTLVTRKTLKSFCNNVKSQKMPTSEHLRFENYVTPIIDKILFDKVQEIFVENHEKSLPTSENGGEFS